MKDDKILTVDQAVSVISKKKMIHTFRSMGFLVGADWKRSELIKTLKKYHDKIEIGGDQCKRMGHGLVVWTPNEPLFVEADRERIEAIEVAITKLES